MSKKKEPLTSEEIYRINKKKSQIFSRLAPITWYIFLISTVIFFCLMIKNSVGNVTEILELLDKSVYNAEQLAENYAMLVERWGEWEIVGGGAGLVIRYVDIGNALFSGLMITFCVFTILSFICAILFGKIIFPLLSKHFSECNMEMVDLVTLKSAAQIEQMSKKEWF